LLAKSLPNAFIADAEKYLEAFLAGWPVVQLTEKQITAPNVEWIIGTIQDLARGVEIEGTIPQNHPPSAQ
jgi:hypothetical protein